MISAEPCWFFYSVILCEIFHFPLVQLCVKQLCVACYQRRVLVGIPRHSLLPMESQWQLGKMPRKMPRGNRKVAIWNNFVHWKLHQEVQFFLGWFLFTLKVFGGCVCGWMEIFTEFYNRHHNVHCIFIRLSGSCLGNGGE